MPDFSLPTIRPAFSCSHDDAGSRSPMSDTASNFAPVRFAPGPKPGSSRSSSILAFTSEIFPPPASSPSTTSRSTTRMQPRAVTSPNAPGKSHRFDSVVLANRQAPDEWRAAFAAPFRAQSTVNRFANDADDLVVEGAPYRPRLKRRVHRRRGPGREAAQQAPSGSGRRAGGGRREFL